MTKRLYIVRGLPGSGKSTIARQLVTDGKAHCHFESDMFFMVNGVYRFDVAQLAAAHGWCYVQVRRALEQGYSVVVSNTFTQHTEIQPYLDIPDVHKEILVARGNYQNVHGVPEEVLEAMRLRWED